METGELKERDDFARWREGRVRAERAKTHLAAVERSAFFTLTTITISSITIIIIIIINSIVFVIISAPRLFVMFCLDSQGCGKSNRKLNAQIFCPSMFTFSAICLKRCSRDLSLRVFCLPVHTWGPNAHVHASTSCVFSNPQPTTQHHNTHHQPTHAATNTNTNTIQYSIQIPIPNTN